MADRGHRDADRELKRIEKELKEEYEKSYQTMKERADKYFARYDKKVKDWEEKIAKGEATEAEFLEWKKNNMISGSRYNAMVKSLAEEQTMTDVMARDIINGHMADIYAKNYNYAGIEISELAKEDGIGIRFDMVDRRTVERLVKDDKILLPQASLDTIKTEKWNEKKIKSTLFQGVVNGESNDKIARNLRKVTKMDREASIRQARTMTTSAECQGRQDRYEEAEELGIQMQKTWIATLDDRTRDAHAELDGVSVDVSEDFVNSIGSIAFPADPNCPDGANVYNCRCTMISSIKGYAHDLSRRVDARTKA